MDSVLWLEVKSDVWCCGNELIKLLRSNQCVTLKSFSVHNAEKDKK